jgi:hypothetical protein
VSRLDWDSIVAESANIVRSYSTGVTLRQLFYRLVSAQILPNTTNAYKGLSRFTARARREGWFPDLIDRNRNIEQYRSFTGPEDALNWLRAIYRRPRDEGQDYSIYIGVEKSGIVNQLMDWFGDYGIPVLALGGYCSQSFCDTIVSSVQSQARPAVFIYAGDFDASGEDIERDFLKRTNCWDVQTRIALTQQQVIDYNLPPLPGKPWDARAQGFIDKYGELVQVELDALDPNDLRKLYEDEVFAYWDTKIYDESVKLEKREIRQLVAGHVTLSEVQAGNVLAVIDAQNDLGHLFYEELDSFTLRAIDHLRNQLDAITEAEEDEEDE